MQLTYEELLDPSIAVLDDGEILGLDVSTELESDLSCDIQTYSEEFY